MERSKRFLATAATLAAVACETPTAPGARQLDDTGDRPTLDASSTSTTFSGEATVVRADVAGVPIRLVETGPLPESGGAHNKTLAELAITKDQAPLQLLALDARVGHASTVGQGKRSRSQATVADLAIEVAGKRIEATFLQAVASAVCDAAGTAIGAASSMIAGLTIDGEPIIVTGERQEFSPVPGLTIVLNEQHVKQSGNTADVTVNALHITAVDPVLGTKVDVIVAQAHADIRCGACSDNGDDFTTGGGWIVAQSGGRANFAVAGGKRPGWGHLTYHDKAEGLKVKGTAVLSYETVPTPEGGTLSIIHGLAEANGEPVEYTVKTADNGEPGRDDTFYIELSNGYASGSKLGGGNIQFHDRPSRCPVN